MQQTICLSSTTLRFHRQRKPSGCAIASVLLALGIYSSHTAGKVSNKRETAPHLKEKRMLRKLQKKKEEDPAKIMKTATSSLPPSSTNPPPPTRHQPKEKLARQRLTTVAKIIKSSSPPSFNKSSSTPPNQRRDAGKTEADNSCHVLMCQDTYYT